MEKQPLLSVLIPTYNRAHYIREAIDSVLAQEYDNLEIIVVDDGSTDDTQNVVERIVGALRATPLRNRNPIKYFYQENRGISAARNVCLAHASGEYIAWLDSDDYWLPGKLKAQVKYFKEHSDCEIVFSCYANFLDLKEIVEKKEKCQFVVNQLNHAKTNKTYLSTSLAKREVFTKAGAFCEELVFLEDTEMILRWINLEIDINHCVEEIYYKRRLHENNTTWEYNENLINQFFKQFALPNLRKKVQRTYKKTINLQCQE
jgi:glycosyltransferase involved in cell wall biosynthesis